MLTYITDGFIISLLIMAIVFCVKLNKRLATLREMGEDLSPFMKNLGIYLNNISASIDKLKNIAEINNKGLNENIPTAVALQEDFDILLEHSEKIAKRLDEVIDKARQMDHQLHSTLQLTLAQMQHKGSPLIGEGNKQHNVYVQNDRARYRSAPPQKNDLLSLNENPNIAPIIQEEPYTRQQHRQDHGHGLESGTFYTSNESLQTEEIAPSTPMATAPRSRVVPPHERGIMEKLKGLR